MEIEYEHGHTPMIFVYNDTKLVETVDISFYTKMELHKYFQSKGFESKNRQGRKAAAERAKQVLDNQEAREARRAKYHKKRYDHVKVFREAIMQEEEKGVCRFLSLPDMLVENYDRIYAAEHAWINNMAPKPPKVAPLALWKREKPQTCFRDHESSRISKKKCRP